jgi:hypothetical protein
MIPFVRRKPAPEGFFENLGERVINRFPEAKFEDGGKVKKAQDGSRNLYQQITSDGPETYTDGYGTVREMNESPIVTGLRKFHH